LGCSVLVFFLSGELQPILVKHPYGTKGRYAPHTAADGSFCDNVFCVLRACGNVF